MRVCVCVVVNHKSECEHGRLLILIFTFHFTAIFRSIKIATAKPCTQFNSTYVPYHASSMHTGTSFEISIHRDGALIFYVSGSF